MAAVVTAMAMAAMAMSPAVGLAEAERMGMERMGMARMWMARMEAERMGMARRSRSPPRRPMSGGRSIADPKRLGALPNQRRKPARALRRRGEIHESC